MCTRQELNNIIKHKVLEEAKLKINRDQRLKILLVGSDGDVDKLVYSNIINILNRSTVLDLASNIIVDKFKQFKHESIIHSWNIQCIFIHKKYNLKLVMKIDAYPVNGEFITEYEFNKLTKTLVNAEAIEELCYKYKIKISESEFLFGDSREFTVNNLGSVTDVLISQQDDCNNISNLITEISEFLKYFDMSFAPSVSFTVRKVSTCSYNNTKYFIVKIRYNNNIYRNDTCIIIDKQDKSLVTDSDLTKSILAKESIFEQLTQ